MFLYLKGADEESFLSFVLFLNICKLDFCSKSCLKKMQDLLWHEAEVWEIKAFVNIMRLVA